MKLLSKPGVALAGRVHYLAFDLFVGTLEVRTSRTDHMPFALVVTCIALNFMFSPTGLSTRIRSGFETIRTRT